MMNQKEGKIISAKLQDRKIQRIKYFENLTNNLLPTFALPVEEQRLRGFNWRGDERPVDRFVVSDRKIMESRREEVASSTFPDYPHARVYFSDTRDSIMMYKMHIDSLRFAAQVADTASSTVASADTLQPFSPQDRGDDLNEDPREVLADPHEALADHQDDIDSLQERILSRKEIRSLPKDERKKVRKEQRALRKLLRKKKRELRVLDK
jgi:hypothetical protein